jgi:hypothetical protein
MWIAGLAVIAAIAATIQLTRPPELVWWTSPAIGDTGRHAQVRIPLGWQLESPVFGSSMDPDTWGACYRLTAPDAMPAWLRYYLQSKGRSEVIVDVRQYHKPPPHPSTAKSSIYKQRDYPTPGHYASRVVESREGNLRAIVQVRTSDRAWFNATSDTICNSLRIE